MGVGGQRLAPATSPPGKTQYLLYRGLGGPQSRSGQVWKISPLTGIRSSNCPAHRVVVILTELSRPILNTWVRLNCLWMWHGRCVAPPPPNYFVKCWGLKECRKQDTSMATVKIFITKNSERNIWNLHWCITFTQIPIIPCALCTTPISKCRNNNKIKRFVIQLWIQNKHKSSVTCDIIQGMWCCPAL